MASCGSTQQEGMASISGARARSPARGERAVPAAAAGPEPFVHFTNAPREGRARGRARGAFPARGDRSGSSFLFRLEEKKVTFKESLAASTPRCPVRLKSCVASRMSTDF